MGIGIMVAKILPISPTRCHPQRSRFSGEAKDLLLIGSRRPRRTAPLPVLPSWLPSSRCILSSSPLAFFYHFVQIRRWPYLKSVAVLEGRMLRHKLYSMIQVPRLKDENAAELFLGFCIGTDRGCDFAVLPIHGQGGFRRLKRFSASKMPVGTEMVVIFKACVEHRLLLTFGHAIEFALIVVSQTDVLHLFLLVPCGGSV